MYVFSLWDHVYNRSRVCQLADQTVYENHISKTNGTNVNYK